MQSRISEQRKKEEVQHISSTDHNLQGSFPRLQCLSLSYLLIKQPDRDLKRRSKSKWHGLAVLID